MILWWGCAARGWADDAPFTVLPSSEAAKIRALCSRSGPESVSAGWTPTLQQIAEAEARLPSFVQGNGKPDGEVNEYLRQYVGVVAGGKHLIYVNVFPRSLVDLAKKRGRPVWDWQMTFVHVCDGGDSFWGALYDPDAQRFFDPQFNGSA